MDLKKHKWKNIGLTLAVLFLWIAMRFLYVAVLGGRNHRAGFVRFDIYFIFLAPLTVFFLNWYWMRDERTDTLIKWAVSWAAIELVFFVLVIYFAGDPLHRLFLQMPT